MDEELSDLNLSEKEKRVILEIMDKQIIYEDILDRVMAYGIDEKELNKILDKLINDNLIKDLGTITDIKQEGRTIKEIMKDSEIIYGQKVSRSYTYKLIKEMERRGLTKCVNPEAKRFKRYLTTEEAQEIIELMKKDGII